MFIDVNMGPMKAVKPTAHKVVTLPLQTYKARDLFI